MIFVFDPAVRYAIIISFAVGVAVGCRLHDRLWWLVMHKAWVHAHEVQRRKRLRMLQDDRPPLR